MTHRAEGIEIHHGDCVEILGAMPENSVHAIVTDPPYGLEFMGKGWDKLDGAGTVEDPAGEGGFQDGGEGNAFSRARVRYGTPGKRMQEWHERWAAAALRVLRPGGHLVAFGGSRTHHRLMSGIEDAGFQIRDCLMWMYGQGLPKALQVGEAIDRAAGAERPVVGTKLGRPGMARDGGNQRGFDGTFGEESEHLPGLEITGPATPEAEEWEGWATGLKPGWECIVLAMKPIDGTYAANAMKWGLAGLNIDRNRIPPTSQADIRRQMRAVGFLGADGNEGVALSGSADGSLNRNEERIARFDPSRGRWPANVVLTHGEDCERIGERSIKSRPSAPRQTGTGEKRADGWGFAKSAIHDRFGDENGTERVEKWDCAPGCPVAMLDAQSGLGNDAGAASRFFYVGKARKGEREEGLIGKLPCVRCGAMYSERHPRDNGKTAICTRNPHPTVKTIDLMRWLVRLVAPPGGTIIDPFLGSGSTAVAAAKERIDIIGIEREESYLPIAIHRAEHARQVEEAHDDGMTLKERNGGQAALPFGSP